MYTQPPASFAEFLERLSGFFFSPFGVGVGLSLAATLVLLVAIFVSEMRRLQRARSRRR